MVTFFTFFLKVVYAVWWWSVNTER